MIPSYEDYHQLCITQSIIVPDPYLPQGSCIQDSDFNLPEEGDQCKYMVIPQGTICEEVLDILSKLEGPW